MTHGFLWDLFAIFFFVVYFMLLFYILSDLFRDHELNGWAKTFWIIFLILFPFLTILIYMIARGPGMQKRALAQAQQFQKAQDEYIKSVAGNSPTEQIAKAQELLAAGTINQDEFNAIKAKALAS